MTRGLCAVPARLRGALGWVCGTGSGGSASHRRPCGAAPGGGAEPPPPARVGRMLEPLLGAAGSCPGAVQCASRLRGRSLCTLVKPYTILQISQFSSFWEQRRNRSDGSSKLCIAVPQLFSTPWPREKESLLSPFARAAGCESILPGYKGDVLQDELTH